MAMPDSPGSVTRLLAAMRAGRVEAEAELLERLYGELKKLARQYMRHERPGHMLQPSALVNEAYLRLLGSEGRSWHSRPHFLAHAAQAMRRILVDHARARRAEKRGGADVCVSLDELLSGSAEPEDQVATRLTARREELIAIDTALNELAALDARQAKIIELRYFTGLEEEEIAVALGVSARTVFRQLRAGRLWLLRQIERTSHHVMTPERWSRVTHLVNEALDSPPDRRPSFLDSACGGDESLRADVESLLAQADRTNGRLAEPWFNVDEALHRLTREATAVPLMVLSVGMRLGPYEVLSPLGQGGMGEVWRARDTRLARTVAIKVLSHDLVVSPQAHERFQREARAIAALQHPHICTIYDVGETAGHQEFLVMELLEGETLHRRLARGPFDPAVLAEIGVALADALDTAHAAGILHRDIKPANIFLTARGPKLLDFGLAKDMAEAAAGSMQTTRSSPARLTDPGGTVGTVGYMSPEQLRGEPLDARTDLFSFGLVLYEMATGRPAFSGSTSAVVSAAILNEAPRAPRMLRPDLPAALEQLLYNALEKGRDVRCQTASELRANLKRLKRDLDAKGSGLRSPFPWWARGRPTRRRGGGASSRPMRQWWPRSFNGTGGSQSSSAVVAMLAVVGTVATGWRAAIGRNVNAPVEPVHRRITFVGDVLDAALSRDGRTAAFIDGETTEAGGSGARRDGRAVFGSGAR